jgi:dienelactone hydrolase
MRPFAGLAALLLALPIWSAGANLAPAADRPPRLVELESPLSQAGPKALQGYLRLPDGPGPSPAVVLLHGCGGAWRGIDERWGKRLAAWGYVTLTIDRFGTRGITNACTGALLPQPLNDAYRALNFLVGQSSVDPSRVAVVGFSQGALLALLSVERGQLERSAEEKFSAAIGFYPPCLGVKGNMTVPTLIMIGELDDWTPAKECRNLAEGRDDWGISREKGKGFPIELIVHPGAYHDFDIPAFATPTQLLGHHLEFNKAALDRSIDALRKFLYATIGNKEKQP